MSVLFRKLKTSVAAIAVAAAVVSSPAKANFFDPLAFDFVSPAGWNIGPIGAHVGSFNVGITPIGIGMKKGHNMSLFNPLFFGMNKGHDMSLFNPLFFGMNKGHDMSLFNPLFFGMNKAQNMSLFNPLFFGMNKAQNMSLFNPLFFGMQRANNMGFLAPPLFGFNGVTAAGYPLLPMSNAHNFGFLAPPFWAFNPIAPWGLQAAPAPAQAQPVQCSINAVPALTKDVADCEKAGGEVNKAKKASLQKASS